ncbi:ABC transporter ATP-binding protein [Pseudoalteromonas luteoviolacea]|uniref:ABC transporter ATP-binding protein n=1 Tax=Pseudoalteromonas luteoviolacea TaxID=43657 RepID=A0A0C1QFU1_9GAMM|nr:ATP-binding cassette domain-containing protein [Pseudoalteromonas luteoviolacea]KID58170.1 ABC transporter ATP-binding protein [Pseudoalteromonas luteoviolacea]
MIKVENLSKVFVHKPIFEKYHIEFSAPKVCLEAPNGLGKSTLFSIIAGLDRAYAGIVSYDGERLKTPQDKVALASDNIKFPAFLTAKQLLTMTQQSWQCPFPDQLIELLGFSSFLDTTFSALSSGNQKKLQLINALMRQTPYVILDEPSAALDHQSTLHLIEYLKDYQGQILISCHEPKPFFDMGFVPQSLFSS